MCSFAGNCPALERMLFLLLSLLDSKLYVNHNSPSGFFGFSKVILYTF